MTTAPEPPEPTPTVTIDEEPTVVTIPSADNMAEEVVEFKKTAETEQAPVAATTMAFGIMAPPSSSDQSSGHIKAVIPRTNTGTSSSGRKSSVSMDSQRVTRAIKNASTTVAHGVTHTVDRSSRWTYGVVKRGITNIPTRWPRVYSIIIGVILPVWLLIGVATLLGFYLAHTEMPEEFAGNDGILAMRATILMQDFLEREAYELSGNATKNVDDPDAVRRAYNRLLQTKRAERVLQTSEFTWDGYFDGSTLQTFDELSGAFSDLSFNWIRCWDKDIVDLHNVFRPSDLQIKHARYEKQLEFYIESWRLDHLNLYQQYVHTASGQESSQDLRQLAYDRATSEATGSSGCQENFAGTSFFFFTIMTTVGYGNQAPVTQGGRAMIWTAGFLSILLFATVLGFAGYIISSIFEDLMSRVKVRFLKHPVAGCLLWGTLWFLWMLVIARSIAEFWSKRLGDDEFATRSETLWFAFISTTTVGLGDFYLQPEVTFLVDTLNFSLLFLVGFVLLSSFFANAGSLLSKLAPNIGSKLPERLEESNLFACEPMDFGFPHNYGYRTEAQVLHDRRKHRLSHLEKMLHEHRREHDDGLSLKKKKKQQQQEEQQNAESNNSDEDAHDDDNNQQDEHEEELEPYDIALQNEATILKELLQTIEEKQEKRMKEREMKQRMEEQQQKMLNHTDSSGHQSSGDSVNHQRSDEEEAVQLFEELN